MGEYPRQQTRSGMIYFWIALGSAIGGAGRYWCSNLVSGAFGNACPWGTIAVNVAGSFLIGFLALIDPFSGRFLAAGIGSARVPHHGRVRGLHHLLGLQPADAGPPADRPMAPGPRQHRPVGGAVPPRGLAGTPCLCRRRLVPGRLSGTTVRVRVCHGTRRWQSRNRRDGLTRRQHRTHMSVCV